MIEIKKVHLDSIKPYWRNPMQGTNIEEVKESILEYGYNQPIVVDQDMVIIVGHSRYKALQDLAVDYPEFKEVDVIISDLDAKKAKEYRIIDNKSREKNLWDFSNLAQEMREIDRDLLSKFYSPEELNKFIDVGVGAVDFKGVEQESVNSVQRSLEGQMLASDQQRQVQKKKINCPECGTEIEVS